MIFTIKQPHSHGKPTGKTHYIWPFSIANCRHHQRVSTVAMSTSSHGSATVRTLTPTSRSTTQRTAVASNFNADNMSSICHQYVQRCPGCFLATSDHRGWRRCMFYRRILFGVQIQCTALALLACPGSLKRLLNIDRFMALMTRYALNLQSTSLASRYSRMPQDRSHSEGEAGFA